MDQELFVVVKEHVAWVVLDRPHRRNALSIALTRRLLEALIELDDDDQVRAIAITGAGNAAFCAGADLKEMDEMVRVQGYAPPAPMRGVERDLCETLLEVGKPTVAVLNGPAVGAGCELALACDIRIAADHAFLQLPEAKRGLGAHFAAVILPRLGPRAVAFRMLYTGAPMTVADAERWGLVVEVVPEAALHDAATELLLSIVGNAPLALRRFKETATKTWSMSLPGALRLDAGPDVYGSRDREEGVRAYVERRTPVWEGR